jgi:hypothetical protein
VAGGVWAGGEDLAKSSCCSPTADCCNPPEGCCPDDGCCFPGSDCCFPGSPCCEETRHCVLSSSRGESGSSCYTPTTQLVSDK